MVICNNCGSIPSNSSTTKCQVCGASITASKPNPPNPGGYCGKCGTPLAAKYSPCSNCGHIKTTFTTSPPPAPQAGSLQSPLIKSTATTVVLALVLGIFGICGVGHFYIGKISRGVVLLVIGIILGIIVWVSMGIGLVAFLPFLGWTVYDAHKDTQYYNAYCASHHKPPW